MFRAKLAARLLAVIALIGAVLFGSAGRLDLPFFWAYLAVMGGFGLFIVLTLPQDLLVERVRPGAEGRDNLRLLRLVAALVLFSQLVLAGLDAGRLPGAHPPGTGLRVVGLAGLAAVLGTWYWAMRSNPFFSAAVRIQKDRGHTVVSSGPYRFVRHPGYATFVLLGWGGPLALGSWWAVLLHLGIVVLFVRRAALEDRMLREELEGYAAYAASVRYRFVPGVW